jgi:hypothetical protein
MPEPFPKLGHDRPSGSYTSWQKQEPVLIASVLHPPTTKIAVRHFVAEAPSSQFVRIAVNS